MLYNPKRLIFTVTNDLNYDQRMIRICNSLQANGYNVLLTGRKLKSSLPLIKQTFSQKRLFCFFKKGKLFYIEYNIRLLFFLLFQKADLICAIDLDTIIPCYFASILRNKVRVYDAHELFSEMKEVVTRPSIYKIWKSIERRMVHRFKNGYTVNKPIRDLLQKEYGVNYEIILNTPPLSNFQAERKTAQFIIYQGAVNEGRSFETLIPAFQRIDCPLWIFGDGNYLEQAKALTKKYNLEEKVIFKGKMPPEELIHITPMAVCGITLFENTGLSNYYSAANRFFDYMHAGIPQLCVDYPVYREINQEYEIALLINDLDSKTISNAITDLLTDQSLQQRLSANCVAAARKYNWQNQEQKLVTFYNKLFAH